MILDLMLSKRPRKLKRIGTNCRARPESLIFSITNTSRDTLFVDFMWSQNIKTTEQIVNELSEPPGKRDFLALSTLQDSLYS